MPHQNRVTPAGDLISTPARGTLMGNRGCLHDARQQVRRTWQTQRWICCQLSFKGRRRTIMRPGHYTELFFLDEATALAAGHRPCAECQRDRFRLFQTLWAQVQVQALAGQPPRAPAIDAVLHTERLTSAGHKRLFAAALATLPSGTFVLAGTDQVPHLVLPGVLCRWTPDGYGPPCSQPPDGPVPVLTPRSLVRLLKLGYPVDLHPSAGWGRASD